MLNFTRKQEINLLTPNTSRVTGEPGTIADPRGRGCNASFNKSHRACNVIRICMFLFCLRIEVGWPYGQIPCAGARRSTEDTAMTLPVSSYEELLIQVRELTHETILLQRQLSSDLFDNADPPDVNHNFSGVQKNYERGRHLPLRECPFSLVRGANDARSRPIRLDLIDRSRSIKRADLNRNIDHRRERENRQYRMMKIPRATECENLSISRSIADDASVATS